MRALFACLVLLVGGCHDGWTLTMTTSPVVDEQPLAGVDTLELRWTRAGAAPVVEHVAYRGGTSLPIPHPSSADGTTLEVAAIANGRVVAAGRTAVAGKDLYAYVGLVDRFVATPADRAVASARFGASATRLADGRVLLAGGATRGSAGLPDPSSISAAVDLYDPRPGRFTTFSAAGLAERIYHAAGPSSDGGVMLVGGLGKFGPLDDIYVIGLSSSRVTGKLPSPRWGAAAVTLADGTLLVVGGYATTDGLGGGTLAPDAVVVAADGTSTTTVALPSPRAFAVATLLADGRVLVTGGVDGTGPRGDALVYAPGDAALSPLAPASARAAMLSPRVGHAAALLPSGEVFVFGGNDGHKSVALPELWSPDAGGFVDARAFNLQPRQHAATTLLADGSVLVAGGEQSPQPMAVPSPVLDSLLYRDGTLGDESAATPARAEATATTLPDGSVLYVGGAVGDPRSVAGGAQLFVPCFGACLAVTP